ncbi:MAG: M48 metallopeptidase family protein [Candidatus Binatia bacterium]
MTRCNDAFQRHANGGWTPLEEVVSRDLLKTEVYAWAERMGVDLKELHIRPMTRKWGSCSSNGRVTLNVDLLRQSAEFRRRVIVEELLHLQVPNHGKLFRALLRAYLGGSGEIAIQQGA